ncbi:hypothetical protein BDN72DRAFT_157110 [Pluteus cervinus]|uniref:Uncharacterized protein n=1 Tax=Pluteus cervinus TaxID=181527 RepID=A0ACD3ALN5_9AGAR|nr:hypothetical protein BDN72DRAFT_157110 [Pluteus cervinus]
MVADDLIARTRGFGSRINHPTNLGEISRKRWQALSSSLSKGDCTLTLKRYDALQNRVVGACCSANRQRTRKTKFGWSGKLPIIQGSRYRPLVATQYSAILPLTNLPPHPDICLSSFLARQFFTAEAQVDPARITIFLCFFFLVPQELGNHGALEAGAHIELDKVGFGLYLFVHFAKL